MVTAIIPIILIVGLGYLLECRRTMDVGALSAVAIYVLLPSLVLTSLLTTHVTLGQALPLVAVILLVTAALWTFGKSVAYLRHYDRDEESFFLLTVLFMNAGNMGMPVALYAFGDQGLDLAVIWVLVINALTNTVAVYYASRHRGGSRQALLTVFRLPSLYAAGAALIMRALGLTLPGFLLDPLRLLGRAVIPIAQVLLGIQLAKARGRISVHLSGTIFPSLVRLVVSPALAFAFVNLLGLHGIAAKVAVLLAAMPIAVNSALLSTEFGLQPRRVATAVFASTVASFVSVSLILVVVG